MPIGWEQIWARRITGQSLAKAPGGRRDTCAQRSLLDFWLIASEGGLPEEEEVKSRKRGDEKEVTDAIPHAFFPSVRAGLK